MIYFPLIMICFNKTFLIYPSFLKINKENINPKQASFLDLEIKIDNNEFISNVFDKRDNFNFKIISFPNASSNIHLMNAANVYISQLIRISRICTLVTDFHKKHNILTKKLINNGFNIINLVKIFKKFYKNYSHLLIKWNYKSNQVLYYIKHGFDGYSCF